MTIFSGNKRGPFCDKRAIFQFPLLNSFLSCLFIYMGEVRRGVVYDWSLDRYLNEWNCKGAVPPAGKGSQGAEPPPGPGPQLGGWCLGLQRVDL